MEEHPKVWTYRRLDGTLNVTRSRLGGPWDNSVEVYLVPVKDHEEMMRAWNKCTGEQLRATIAGFTETTDDE